MRSSTTNPPGALVSSAPKKAKSPRPLPARSQMPNGKAERPYFCAARSGRLLSGFLI